MQRIRGAAILMSLVVAGAACQPNVPSPQPGATATPSPALTNATSPAGEPPPAGTSVDLLPRVADRPTGGDGHLVASMPPVRGATAANWGPIFGEPGGPPLAGSSGEPFLMGLPVPLAVLEQRGPIAGQTWYRVYAMPNPTMGGTDVFTWIPGTTDGRARISLGLPGSCPPGATAITDLANIDPFTRVRCLGAASIELEGISWARQLLVAYDVRPAFFGQPPTDATPDRGFSLHQGSVQLYPAPTDSLRFLDIETPDGVAPPPFGFTISVRLHVADRESTRCVRRVRYDDVPLEAASDSQLWCATRLIVEQWTPLLGPEGRAIDVQSPQLHRHPIYPGPTVCGGVGMPHMVFRMDPSALDPVRLEAPGYPSAAIIASFGPSFRAAYMPDLVVLDKAGRVVARDGTPVDPDGTLSGHPICPGGLVVTFDE